MLMTEPRHIIEAQQFDRTWLENELFPNIIEMEDVVKRGGSDNLKRKIMITLFYEPSTRTRISFEMAMKHQGGDVVSSEAAGLFSSAVKGEIIEDTSRIVSSYHPHVIVIRADQEGIVKAAAQYSSVPIINAGDGMGQHPTQALLDIYTILKELGGIDGTSIAMVGDLYRGRTVRSLAYLLGKFSGIKIYFVSSKPARMRDDIKDYLKRHNVYFEEHYDLRYVASDVNAIYMTRDQKERGDLPEEDEKENGHRVVDKEVLDIMKKDAIIMHPLPRNEEISPEVDKDPRAAYFRQGENGLYVRMALLHYVINSFDHPKNPNRPYNQATASATS